MVVILTRNIGISQVSQRCTVHTYYPRSHNIDVDRKTFRQMWTLDWNGNHLLEPDKRRRVMIYSSELPTCLTEQVAEISDRAFFSINVAHHLRWERKIYQQSHRQFQVPLLFLTMMSAMYAIEAARPVLRSNGSGGTGNSAPGISCATGSSQTVENTCSMMTSRVFCPAAARRCFNMVRQYSSAQSWNTRRTRKTETSSCHAGCGSKKSRPWKPKCQCQLPDCGDETRQTLNLHTARFECIGLVLLPVL